MKSLVIACMAIALMATPCRAAPLEVYGGLPAMQQVRISPDAKSIAYIGSVNGVSKVVVRDVATKKALRAVGASDHKIRDFIWAGPDHLIITTSSFTHLRGVQTSGQRSEYVQGAIYNLSTGKSMPVLSLTVSQALPLLYGEPALRTVDGKLVAYVQAQNFIDGFGRISLFQTDIQTGRTKLVQNGETGTSGWLVDANGVVIGQTEYNAKAGLHWVKVRRDGKARTIEVPEKYDSIRLIGIGREADTVLISYWEDEDKFFAQVAQETHAWSEPLTEGPVDRLFHDPVTDAFVGYSALVGEEDRTNFFNPEDQKTWRSVIAPFKGQRVRFESWSASRRQVVVRLDPPNDIPAYGLVDLDAKTAVWLGDVYSGLTAADIAPVRTVSYKAADGKTITGYLTLPLGAEAKNLPLIVLPHGGPAVRDEPGFDWWSQALASRGYAVLQPNYRGSDGFGLAFLRAGYGEWGKKMQTDLSDGVRYLVKDGVVDPKRVCIVGASYGGYAALAGATIDRGAYRCAASVAGPSDLARMLRSDHQEKGVSALRYWSRFMGVDGARDPDLVPISPALQAARADIPILLVHGKNDSVVLYEQSQIMADALKKAGKPVEFVTLDGEDHWMSLGATRLQMLQSVVAFVEKHNPPNTPKVP